MNHSLVKTLVLLVGVSNYGWSQPLMRNPPLPYKDCKPERLFVSEKDSVRQRTVLDSIAVLFAGSWQLAEEEAGACFVAAHAPAQNTEMVLNQKGQGLVFVEGRQVTSFQLLLSFYWGNAHFVMNETIAKPYFDFLPPHKSRNKRNYDPKFEGAYPNIVRVCEETLIMTGPRTGLCYVFRRLPPPYGPQQ